MLTQLESKFTEKVNLIEELEVRLRELEPPAPSVDDLSSRRITCPMCSAIEIKQTDDKSKVLTYIGNIPMYAKKNRCLKCGFEFD